MSILIVEDDLASSKVIKFALRKRRIMRRSGDSNKTALTG